jgi:outer membrane protein
MLKKITLALALFILPMGVFAQSYKFGHINAQEVITAMPEFIKAQNDLKALQKKYSDDLKRTQDEFNKKYQEFMAQKDSLPTAIAERRQKELEDMAQRQQQFQQDAENGMQKSQEEMLTPIYQKLDGAIKAVGASEGVIYIFDMARTPIAYVNESQSINLTSKVKARLGITGNSSAPAAAPRKK